MRVLVVTVVHVPFDARIHHRQVRALVRAGHQVVLAGPFSDTGSDPSDALAPTVDLPRAVGRARGRALAAARRLLRDVGADVDVVVLHDPELLLAVPRGLPTPVVWDVHEDLAASLEEKTWLPGSLVRPVRRAVHALERRAERRHHLLLAEHDYADRFLDPHPVVPNLPWLPPPTRGPVSDRVVQLGRVSRNRGVHELVEVGRRLASAGLSLELIGPVDGDVADEVARAEQRGHLRSSGFVPNELALQRLDGALAGLSLLRDVPNYRHSMPTKVVEYQASGVPVVTTPLPRAREVVESAGSGIVVPFEDPEAAAEAVLGLASDRERARRLGAAGRHDAEAGRSWDAAVPGFLDALESAATTRTRP